MNINSIFRSFATAISNMVGSAYTFALAITLIVFWATTGPFFGFSNTWQLVINTFTTITTFLIVFLIQNTQNRDSRAVHLKLDELLKSIKGARDEVINVEDLPDEVLNEMHQEFKNLRQKYAKKLKITVPNDETGIEKIISHFFRSLNTK